MTYLTGKSPRLTIACLVAACAFPVAASAQTSSDAQYSGVLGEVIKNVAPKPPAPAAAVAPAAKVTPAVAAPKATLPFTGQDIVLMLLAGAGIAGVGFALRRRVDGTPSSA